MKILKYRVNNSETYETLTIAEYEGGDKDNIVTQSDEINAYWKLSLSNTDKKYIFNELWERHDKNAFVMLCSSEKYNGFTVIYNDKRTTIRLSEFDLQRYDLIRCSFFQDYNLHQIMSKYRLSEHENKKPYEIVLFNYLSQNEYWLPLEICIKIELLIAELMMSDYFYPH